MTGTAEHEHSYSHQHGHEHDDQHGHQHDDAGGMTDLLDLDAEVLHDYWTAALDWVRDAAAPGAPRRVLDLGAGTGTGAIGLAGRFPDAEVTAVDIEADSLQLLRDRAGVLGLAPRLRAVEADLDAGWPDLGPIDLTWASMSLHHMADPGAVLRDVLAATSAGGLVAVAEFPEPLRFLPADLGTGKPGFEERVLEALGRVHAAELPTLGSAFAPRLTAAGWQVTGEREFPVDLDPPAHPKAGLYAKAWFTRLAHGRAGSLDPADRETLAALLDDSGPHSLLRGGLHIRGTRTVTLARRG
jgi:SAM-dependent methyltransferase